MKLLNKLIQFVMVQTNKYSIDESHGLGHSMNVLKYAHDIFTNEFSNSTTLSKNKEYSSRNILDDEYVKSCQKIIYISAVLHDMCDKKYMDEQKGIMEIDELLCGIIPNRKITVWEPKIEELKYDYLQNKQQPFNNINQLLRLAPTELSRSLSPRCAEATARSKSKVVSTSIIDHSYKISAEEIEIIKKIITSMSYSTVKQKGFPDLGKYQIAYHIVREADLLSAYDFDRCMIYCMYKINGNINTAFIEANSLFEKRMFKHFDDGLFVTEYSNQIYRGLHDDAIKTIQKWKEILQII